jgi:alpha-ribazole phosphatase
MDRLYLIRHGETEGGGVKRYKGAIDVPLSEKGMKQMERVSEYIVELFQNSSTFYGSKQSNPPAPPVIHPTPPLEKGGLMKAVYCSDLKRAIKSAEIIAEPYRLNPVKIPDLRERNFGIWEGMSFDEIREKYPSEFESWANNPLKYSPTGGESTIEVRDRVIKALDKILNNHNSQNTEYTPPTHPSPSRGEGKGGGGSPGPGVCALKSEHITIVAHGGVNRIILCHLLGIPLENIFRIEQDCAALNVIEFWDKYPVVKLINGIING